MKKLTKPFLIKIALMLTVILLAIFIIKELQIIRIAMIMLGLTLPIFFGFIIAWLLKPVMLFFNRFMSILLSAIITYLLLFGIIGAISYLALPVIIQEVGDLTNFIIELFELVEPEYIENMDLSFILSHAITWLNITLELITNIFLNSLYALFFAFFFLIHHQKISRFIAAKIKGDIVKEISLNLKDFVRGIMITTTVLLILSMIAFYFIGLPYFILMALVIALTNIIPYIGGFLGGIPVLIIAFGNNTNLGLMTLGAILILQIIDTFLVTPYVMSKVIEINQIIIMIGLIVFGYFFGVIGMLISTPIICVIKTLYEYYKGHGLFKVPPLDKLKG